MDSGGSEPGWRAMSPPVQTKPEPERLDAPPSPPAASPPPVSRIRRFTERLKFEHFLLLGAALVLVALVIVPLLMLLSGSFSTSFTDLGAGWTLDNYRRVYTDPESYELLRNTLVVTVGATFFSLVVGVLLAWFLARANLPTRRILEVLLLVPMFVSPFHLALGWGIAIGPAGAVGAAAEKLRPDNDLSFNSLVGIIFVITLAMAPYTYLFVSASFRNMDPSLEESARMSGLSGFATAMRVTVPLATPAILSAALLTFILVAGQFGVPLIYGVPAGIYVVTTRLYTMTQSAPSDLEGAAALSTMLILVSLIAMAIQVKALGEGVRRFATVTGRGFRPTRVRLGKSMPFALGGIWIYVALCSIIPVGTLIYTALLPRGSKFTDFGEITFGTLQRVLENERNVSALINSVVFSGVAATITVALAAVIAWLRIRSRARGVVLLDHVSMLPAAVPGIVLAIGFLWVFVRTPLYNTMWIIILGYVAAFVPFGLRAIAPGISSIDPTLEEAGRMSGLGWRKRFTRILMPILRPNLIAAWLLCFTVFVKELPIPILLSSIGNEVLAVTVYSAWADGRTDLTAAISTLQIAMIAVVVVIANWLRRD